MSARAAAFFDLDGTLLPLPSLEERFFRALRDRGEIPPTSYFLWLLEAVKLLRSGIGAVAYANKMYLRGVQSFEGSGARKQGDFRAHASGPTGEGQPSAPPKRIPRWPVPLFYEDGVERVAWHARQGHAVVIVSGTLEPLAHAAARSLQADLATRGIVAKIQVCATRLEERHGRWTGQVLGEAMFGKAKERAARELAEEMRLDLRQSWAYGDSAQDRWMLASVGNPAAVNPSAKLAQIAWERGWLVLRTANRLRHIREPLRHAERCA